jgi:hypothetical protein
MKFIKKEDLIDYDIYIDDKGDLVFRKRISKLALSVSFLLNHS